MSLENYSGFNISEIFNPSYFYSGDWDITERLESSRGAGRFMLNSKVENGINLYNNFLNRNYFIPMGNILANEPLARLLQPQIVSSDFYNSVGRSVHFSVAQFFGTIATMLDVDGINEIITAINDSSDLSSIMATTKEVFRSSRKKYYNIKNSKKDGKDPSDIPGYSMIVKEYQKFNETVGSISFEDYLDLCIENLKTIIFGFRFYENFFKKPINTKELLACFNYDKFCLCIAYSILDACHEMENLNEALDNSVNHLVAYVQAVNAYREVDPKYNCVIKDNAAGGKIIKRGVDQLLLETKELLNRHPEFDYDYFSQEELMRVIRMMQGGILPDDFDLRAKKYQEIIQKAITFLLQSHKLHRSWECFPVGSKADPTNDESKRANSDFKTSAEIAAITDERIKNSEICRSFLEQSPIVCKLIGRGTFEDGYQAYIYPNGKVIIEQYYDEVTKPQYQSATYVMDLKDFYSFSQLTKLDLIKIIKNEKQADKNFSSLKRFYHVKDLGRWKEKLNREINGYGLYNPEVTGIIQDLIRESVLKHSNPVRQI